MPGTSIENSKSSANERTGTSLRLDIQWLCGQKKTPDPLPTRQQYQQQQSLSKSPPSKPRSFVNILASILVLGVIGTSTYGVYRAGWLPIETLGMPIATDKAKLTPEEQRQADETIDAILALQEMAAKSEPNTPTQKR
jgi:hypothetical protein